MSDSRDGFEEDEEEISKTKEFPSSLFYNFFHDANEKLKNNYAIKKLIDVCSVSSHPLAGAVINFLRACQKFSSQTDPDFKATREKSIDKEIVLERLNTMANAIKKLIDTDHQKDILPEQQKAIEEAILFGMNFIKERLEVLKNSKDKIYEIYANSPNQLKEVLASTSSSSTQTIKQR